MRRDGTAWTDGWMETWETVALGGGRFPMMPSSSSPLFSFVATFMSREIVASAVDQLRTWLVGAAARLQAVSPPMILEDDDDDSNADDDDDDGGDDDDASLLW